jgi:hypothetical protein
VGLLRVGGSNHAGGQFPGINGSSRFRGRGRTCGGGDPQDRLSQFVFYWQPSLQAELSRVADAGTSTDLAALKQSGDSVRLAPAIAAKLTLPIADQKVSIGAGYTHRFDLDQGWNRSYETASVQYDLTSSVALTLGVEERAEASEFRAGRSDSVRYRAAAREIGHEARQQRVVQVPSPALSAFHLGSLLPWSRSAADSGWVPRH